MTQQNILVLYALQDVTYFTELQKHLALLQRQQVINTYHQGNITAGSTTANEMQQYLEQADIVLPLVSADFLASNQQDGYVAQALALDKKVVPVIVRPCMWQNAAWSNLTVLPHNGSKAISQYPNVDEGFYETATALHKMIDPTFVLPDLQTYQKDVNADKPVYIQHADKIYNIDHIDNANFL